MPTTKATNAQAPGPVATTDCEVTLPVPEDCCVSPCDPPWLKDRQCMIWYEDRYFRVPIGRDVAGNFAAASYIEFRITYQHRLCLVGKQQGGLLYTLTLLPGEKVTLYHSDRFRQITTSESRFSVQTTFSQFLSVIHQSQQTNSNLSLNDVLKNAKSSSSDSGGSGFFGSLLGLDVNVSSSQQASVTDHNLLQTSSVSDTFGQSVSQSAQMTQAERSLVVSTYEDKDTVDITRRTIQNDNACRAVTYFVRQVVEQYTLSTLVYSVTFRVIAPGIPPDFHTLGDTAGLPAAIQTQVKDALKLLPKVGEVVSRPQPITLPTDGAVYDAELAHCCSCEPQREAALDIQLEAQKAAAEKACLEKQLLELEVARRQALLASGQLAPFDAPAPASANA